MQGPVYNLENTVKIPHFMAIKNYIYRNPEQMAVWDMPPMTDLIDLTGIESRSVHDVIVKTEDVLRQGYVIFEQEFDVKEYKEYKGFYYVDGKYYFTEKSGTSITVLGQSCSIINNKVKETAANFVMNYEKITFYEAVVKVASKIGMLLDVKVTNKTTKKDKLDKAGLFIIITGSPTLKDFP